MRTPLGRPCRISIRALVPALALVSSLGTALPARAQDGPPAAGEPLTSTDPTTLTYDYLVDGSLAADDPANRKFATLQAAYAAAPDGTADQPTVIGIAPNVYLLPGPMTGASLNITKSYITLLGLTNNRRSVVLADNRGNQQGASDNGYVIVVNATGFTAKNLTILNYCNVDYTYPGDPTKNLTKRSAVITQAVALQASGDKHVYQNVAVLSRLDTMFLQTMRSYFKNVFIEGTDDFIGGGTVSAWEDSEIFFPTGSGVMSATNIAFINSKFTASNGLQFAKGPGQGVALINCSMPAPGPLIAWLRAAAPPRPNQYYVTHNVKDAMGNPAMIVDGSTGPATFDYSWELSDQQALAFNPWNLLRATPTGVADDWDPAGARGTYESAGQGSVVFRMALTGTPASVRTGGPGATIGATVAPIRVADPSITWSTPSSEITLSRTSASACLFQLFRIDSGVGTPLNDTQVLTGVFRPNTDLVMKVTGDQLTALGHNSANGETLSLAGTITPNDFGGAGVAWGGTVSRGNSNVYSKLEITYPGAVAPSCESPPPQPPQPPQPPTTTTTTTTPPKASSGCGCASGGTLQGGDLLAMLLFIAWLAMRSARADARH